MCELVRRAAKGTKELRLEDGTELPGEKTFPDYVVDLMDSYLAVLPDAKPHAYPAAEREQLMERHCRHTEDGGIDYDYYQDMTLDTFIFNMRNVGAGALYAKRGPFWHGGHMEQCHFEELFRLIEEEGEKVFGETQERYADLAANDITAEAEHQSSVLSTILFPGSAFSCLRGCWFWMRYMPQTPTSSTAIWKTQSVPPCISICSRWRVFPARLALLSALC